MTTPKRFEEFLQEQHMEAEPMILDDDLPDAYEAWICERDIQEIIDWAEEWGAQIRASV